MRGDPAQPPVRPALPARLVWWQRLGTGAVVSWPGFWLLLAFSLFIVVISTPAASGAQLWRPAVGTSLALLSLFAVLLPARATVLRNAEDRPRPVVATAVYLVAALVRSTVFALLLVALGVNGPEDVLRRITGAFPAFLIVLVVLDLSLGAVREHRRTMASLTGQETRARRSRDATLTAIAEQRAEARLQVHNEVDAIIERLDADDPDALLTDLRRAVDDVVRPLSHSIEASIPESTPGVPPPSSRTTRSLLDDATSDTPVEPVALAASLILLGSPYVLVSLPQPDATGAVLIGLVGTWAGGWCARWLLRPLLPRVGVAVRAILLTAALLLVGALVAWALVALLGSGAALTRVAAACVVLIPTIGWGLALARAAERQRRRLELEAAASAERMAWAAARVRCSYWQEHRDLAQALHGPVQSALGTAAIRLQLAQRGPGVDRALRDTLRRDLRDALVRLDDSADPASSSGHVDAALAETTATWAGICRIRWDVDEPTRAALRMDPVGDRVVADILTEACWNAIHHGRAARVDITCAPVTGPLPVLLVRVEDDGSGPVSGSAPGYGTRMLDTVCLDWSRARAGDRTVLDARLPLAPGSTG